MPTRATTASMDCDTEAILHFLSVVDPDDSDDEDALEMMYMLACTPYVRQLVQEIGPEVYSMERLQRETATYCGPDDMPWNIYQKFGYHLDDLPTVIEALNPPIAFRTLGDHVFTGEEGVLLMLRRFSSTCPLLELTKESGRSISAISEAVLFMVEHIIDTFPHLVDERSFTSWASRFADFARCFVRRGCPIPNLIAFIDGKLWPVCRPTKLQQVLYSGHKRVHGVKTQGLVFPNGIQPWPYGPMNGSRHDSAVLRESRIIDILRQICQQLGVHYVIFGDSAYPISRCVCLRVTVPLRRAALTPSSHRLVLDSLCTDLYRMHKGNMTVAQQAFNDAMGPERVTVEWGFGKICALWPFFDFRQKLRVLKTPVGLYLKVANVLTNIHTIIYGSAISNHFGMSPPDLDTYMAGGPFD